MKSNSCTADRIQRGTVRSVNPDPWTLYRGTVQYYIIGPGPTAMHPCSQADYGSRQPTMSPRESQIAHLAIAELNRTHPGDHEAGIDDIKTALATAAKHVPEK